MNSKSRLNFFNQRQGGRVIMEIEFEKWRKEVGWIRVEDVAPDLGELYLVATPYSSETSYPAEFNGEEWCSIHAKPIHILGVTHYMQHPPLPDNIYIIRPMVAKPTAKEGEQSHD